MVLIRSDIWLIETPNAAGAISFRIAPHARDAEVEAPARQQAHPAAETEPGRRAAARRRRTPPSASTITGGSKRSAKNSAPTMKATLSSAGVIAGTEKRFQVLSTPAANATSEMKAMYGKVMRSIVTVSSNFAGSAAKPGAEM